VFQIIYLFKKLKDTVDSTKLYIGDENKINSHENVEYSSAME